MAKNVTINTSQLNIAWQPNTQYRISLSEGFVLDASPIATPSPAVANLRTLTTNTAPTVTASSPINGDNDSENLFNISLSFNRTMQKGTTGTVRLYNSSNTLIVSYPINSNKIAIAGNNILIDLEGLIDQVTSYYLLIDNTCFKDLDNFFFAGYTNNTDFTYTTGGSALPRYNNVSQRFTMNWQDHAGDYAVVAYGTGNTGIVDIINLDTYTRAEDTININGQFSNPSIRQVTVNLGFNPGSGALAKISPSGNEILVRWGEDRSIQNIRSSTGVIRYTFNPPSSRNESFGSSIDTSDFYAAVGDPFEIAPFPNTNNQDSKGSVHVYTYTNGSLYYTLRPPDNISFRNFGASVSISDDYLAVGAPALYTPTAQEWNLQNGPVPEQVIDGKAYIYDINTSELIATLNNPDQTNPGNPFVRFNFPNTTTIQKDYFGYDVVYRGPWLAVTAPSDGKVYIYYNRVYSKTIVVPFYFTADELSNQLKQNALLYPDIYGDYLVVVRSIGTPTTSNKILVYDLTTGILIQSTDLSISMQNNAPTSINGNYLEAGIGSILTTLTTENYTYDFNYSIAPLNTTTGWSTQPLYANSRSNFDADGDYFAVGTNDSYVPTSKTNVGSVRVYAISNGNLIRTFNNPILENNGIFGIDVKLFDGKVAILSQLTINSVLTDRVSVYNISTGSLIYTIDNPPMVDSSSVSIRKIDVNNNYLVMAHSTAGSDRISFYNRTTGAYSHTISTTADLDRSDNMNSNIIMLKASVFANNTSFSVHNVTNGTLLYTITPGQGEFWTSHTVSESYIAIYGSNNTIRIYNTSGNFIKAISTSNEFSYNAGRRLKIVGDYVLIDAGISDDIYFYSIDSGTLKLQINDTQASLSDYFGEYFDVVGNTLIASQPASNAAAHEFGSYSFYLP